MDPRMDTPLEAEGCLIMKVEQNRGWAPEPVLEGPGISASETFRKCFRQFCYEDASGPHEAFSKLWELCCRWLKPEVRSKERILELLVIEQFLSVLPEKIQARAQKQCPESGEEAVALVLHLEKEAGRLRQQVSGAVRSEKQAPLGAVWAVEDFWPETQPRVASREKAGSRHPGPQEQLSARRDHRPCPKTARASLWVPRPAEERDAGGQQARARKPPAGSQGAARDVHVARGLSCRRSVPQAPARRDLSRDSGEESVGDPVSLGGAAAAASKVAQRREPWALGPHPAHGGALRSSCGKAKPAAAAKAPARGAGKMWRQQQQWVLEDEKVAGVHWSYEETKTFLGILRGSRFYETLQACPRNSQVYGAVAERLRACGFLRTPEQCRTKFKSLQKSYRKVRSGHALEPCAFFEDMDALLNPAAQAPAAARLREAGSLPGRPRRAGGSGQARLVGQGDAAGESDSEETAIQVIRKSDIRGAPVSFQNLSGVHWGYEETKTFLDILRELRFYEALQACHRKSKLYGAVAEQLRACGFLRTPEQCRTKFKSLQKSYRKVKSGHALEPCAFYREMDALVSSRVPAPSAGTPAAPPPSGPEREAVGVEPQEAAGWEPETSPVAIVEDSGSERMSEEEIVQELEFQGLPGRRQSPSDVEMGGGPAAAHGVLTEKARRVVPQKAGPGPRRAKERPSGAPWESQHRVRPGRPAPQPRDGARAAVPPRPALGRSARPPCRLARQKENSYECGVCGRCFGRSRSLLRHQRVHAGEKPFRCLDCGKSFTDPCNFGAHRRTHSGGKPFQCGECGRSFSNSAHCSAHRRLHAGEGAHTGADGAESLGGCPQSQDLRRGHPAEKPPGGAPCGRHFSKSSVPAKHREAT